MTDPVERKAEDSADADAALMALAARGDTGAFAALVEKYRNPLLNFFLAKGVNHSDGEDLAQKTFLKLWNSRERYVRSAKFTTFLYTVANNVRLDSVRSAVRRRRLEDELTREAELPREEPQAAPAEGEDVRRAVAQLSPALREVVELAVFLDRPYADVSEALGIPVGTVKSRMFNALRKLKEILDEQRS